MYGDINEFALTVVWVSFITFVVWVLCLTSAAGLSRGVRFWMFSTPIELLWKTFRIEEVALKYIERVVLQRAWLFKSIKQNLVQPLTTSRFHKIRFWAGSWFPFTRRSLQWFKFAKRSMTPYFGSLIARLHCWFLKSDLVFNPHKSEAILLSTTPHIKVSSITMSSVLGPNVRLC